MTEPTEAPAYEVRLARVEDAGDVARVCREGFAASSVGLLSAATVERQAARYYDVSRVRDEIASAGEAPQWQGYVVAATGEGRILGAAGGGVTDRVVGNLHVLYLDLTVRGRGIGTTLLEFVTQQQKAAGASEQWVSVTDGNRLGIPFYLARGFVVHDKVPFDPADDPPEAFSLRMQRAI
ncbi:MAG: GNAT family N-acetyltransferase [Actinobacteria bacterium]|nr:GNAT family N-acetyltransferase [Actinomycetota bacterium]